MNPPVLQMQVHLPGMHMVPFNDHDNLDDVLGRAKNQRSILTEFFRMNIEDPNAQRYLYREFPEHYTWNKSKKKVGLLGKGSSRLEGWCMRTHLGAKDFIFEFF